MGKSKRGEYLYRCKCCLDEVGLKNMWTEYYRDGEREIYGEMLTDCFALSWEQPPGDTEMEHICETCVSRLRDAINFKKEILYTEHLILEQLKNVTTEHIKQEEESEDEIETEYLSIEFLEDDNERDESDIKIERPQVKQEKDVLMINRRSKKYTDDDLEKCLEAVRTKALSQNKASILYSVPRKAISSAIAKLRNTCNKTVKTKKLQDTNTNDDNVETTEFQTKMFPEFENFGNDISELFECSNATPIRCRGGIGYKCCFCTEEYPDSADLKKHTMEQHDNTTKSGLIKGKYVSSYLVKLDITGLLCTLCKQGMGTVDDLIDHLITVHGKSIHRNIKNYILPFKFQGEELRCIICYSLFNRFKVLQEHMSTHFRNYICNECDAGFVTRTILLNHIKCHQTGLFKCDHCTKTYNTMRKKRAHERLVHIHGSKLNKCGYCNEKFDRYQKREEHLVKVHGVRSVTFECQACDKIFMSQRALRDHTKRDHLMERQHTCTVCDMKFFRQSEVTKHMVKHTGVRMFQCEVCSKSYGRRNTLREHMRIHTNDRRFKCEHCGQAFVQKCSWRGHMRAKHGEQV
nr:zinc finger protein 93-like isoform X1 [Vanessa tameamea]